MVYEGSRCRCYRERYHLSLQCVYTQNAQYYIRLLLFLNVEPYSQEIPSDDSDSIWVGFLNRSGDPINGEEVSGVETVWLSQFCDGRIHSVRLSRASSVSSEGEFSKKNDCWDEKKSTSPPLYTILYSVFRNEIKISHDCIVPYVENTWKLDQCQYEPSFFSTKIRSVYGILCEWPNVYGWLLISQ